VKTPEHLSGPPDLNRYYVAASKNDKEEAAILVFAPDN